MTLEDKVHYRTPVHYGGFYLKLLNSSLLGYPNMNLLGVHSSQQHSYTSSNTATLYMSSGTRVALYQQSTVTQHL
jgi:hypothetical protein